MKAETATLFDLDRGQAAAEAGIAKAAKARPELLEYIKGLAVRIGRRKRFVTADDIQAALHAQGITDAGNVMGGVFKDKTVWRFNAYVKCTRVNAHSRVIREWEYVGGGRS